MGKSKFVLGRARKTKPLKTQFSTSSTNTLDIPISSLVSDVLVKNRSPFLALYLAISSSVTSTLPRSISLVKYRFLKTSVKLIIGVPFPKNSLPLFSPFLNSNNSSTVIYSVSAFIFVSKKSL